MDDDWISTVFGTIGWMITFAVYGGMISVLLWLSGIVLGYLLRGTPQ